LTAAAAILIFGFEVILLRHPLDHDGVMEGRDGLRRGRASRFD